MAKKVKLVQAAIGESRVGRNGKRLSHIVAVDARGRLFERFSDMDPGTWGQIDPPDEPVPSRQKLRKR